MPQQFTWQKDDLPAALMLEVQFDFVPVSGITPTVEIYKYSDDTQANFSTMTFAASGGNTSGMMEVPSDDGLYRLDFDPRDFGESGNERYYVRYRATVPSGFEGLAEDKNVIGSEIHYFTEISGQVRISQDSGLFASFNP
jgi:hypothetical protein